MEDFHLSWHSICHYSLCAYIQHEENIYEIIHCDNQGSDDSLLITSTENIFVAALCLTEFPRKGRLLVATVYRYDYTRQAAALGLPYYQSSC